MSHSSLQFHKFLPSDPARMNENSHGIDSCELELIHIFEVQRGKSFRLVEEAVVGLEGRGWARVFLSNSGRFHAVQKGKEGRTPEPQQLRK